MPSPPCTEMDLSFAAWLTRSANHKRDRSAACASGSTAHAFDPWTVSFGEKCDHLRPTPVQMAMGIFETIIMVILAIIFPPLPVLLETGCSGTLLLNIVLTIIGWIPGVIHAIYVSVVNPRPVMVV